MTKRKTTQAKKVVTILETFVAGLIHSDWDLSKRIPQGTILTMVRETTNPYDFRAIKLLCKGIKVGYLPNGDRGDVLGYKPVQEALEQGRPVRCKVMNFAPGNHSHRMCKVKIESLDMPESTSRDITLPTF